MAWQSVPSLLIIGGAFNAAAGLLWGLDRLYYGRVSVVSGDISSSLMTAGAITQSAIAPFACRIKM
jgi:hypothetical protein